MGALLLLEVLTQKSGFFSLSTTAPLIFPLSLMFFTTGIISLKDFGQQVAMPN
jgi:hypothetical protein